MDEKKQEREEAREDEDQDGAEVEEHAVRPRFREEDEATEEDGSGEEERGEQDLRRFSDARLKVDIAPLR